MDELQEFSQYFERLGLTCNLSDSSVFVFRIIEDSNFLVYRNKKVFLTHDRSLVTRWKQKWIVEIGPALNCDLSDVYYARRFETLVECQSALESYFFGSPTLIGGWIHAPG